MHFGTSDVYGAPTNTAIVIDRLGNVGIATSTPSNILQVVGSTMLSGALIVQSGITASSTLTVASTASMFGTLTVTSTVQASAFFVAGTRVLLSQQAAIADPTGGGTTAASDTEARTAISAILSALRTHGIIAT